MRHQTSISEISGSGLDDTGKTEVKYERSGDGLAVTLPMSRINPHITCRLCFGYFRSAHTIQECLHTFCKSCIYRYFYDGRRNKCPECQVDLGTNPFSKIMFDRSFQESVSKLLPHIEKEDEELEREFYMKHKIKRKAQYMNASESTDISDPGKFNVDGSKLHGKGRLTTETRKRLKRPAAPSTDGGTGGVHAEISFRLIPDEDPQTAIEYRLPPLAKPFLRTAGSLKVLHLKKYLGRKISDIKCNVSQIEVLCKGAPLGPELSLHFIKRTRWFDPSVDLLLTYRQQQPF